MALVVTPINYQLVHNCDNITNITGPTPAQVTDFYKEGIACVGFVARATGEHLMYATGSWNLTGKTIRLWYMTANLKEIDSYANGGFGIYVLSSTGTSYYYMGGKDTYEGGWINLCVDPSRTVDGGVQPNLTSVTRVGCFQRNAIAGKNQQTTWMDFIHCCDGLSATDTSVYTTNDIFLKDVATTGGWGVVRRISGVYFFTGSLQVDNLEDSGETIIFENRKVSSSLYGINILGDTTLGLKAGDAGVSGLTIKTESLSQVPKFYISSTLTTGETLGLYGCTITDFNTFTAPANATGREYYNSNFTDFNSIVFGDAYFNSCNFINYEAALSLGTSNLQNCSFINGSALTTYQGGYLLDCNFVAANTSVAFLWNQNINTSGRLDGTAFSSSGTGHAIEFGSNTPSSVTFENISFSGYATNEGTEANRAIYNNSGKEITIYLTGGNAPSVRNGSGASTNIISAKSFTFTVSPAITGYEWRIYSVDAVGSLAGAIELDGEESAASSTQVYAYNYVEDLPIAVQILSHPGILDFEESVTFYTLGNENQNVTILLQEDMNN